MSHASAVTTDGRGRGVGSCSGRMRRVLRGELPLGADAAVDVASFPALVNSQQTAFAVITNT